MKRSVLITFSVFVLCALILPTSLVNAYYQDYSTINYQAQNTPVEDGAWTTADEWTDAMTPPHLSASFNWRQKWTYPSDIIQHFLIEFFTDNTNDTADYFQLCVDCDGNGGTAPQSDDIRIDWVGHTVSGLTIYQGNGTGWAVFTGYTWNTDIFINNTLTTSPLNGNTHWVIELRMDRSKAEFDVSGSMYTPWIRLAVYDASNCEAGVQAWPPTSANVPNDWGMETGTTENIPEPLTFVTVAMLSTVAVVVSGYGLRKRQKTKASTH
jgi:hypothetical protein